MSGTDETVAMGGGGGADETVAAGGDQTMVAGGPPTQGGGGGLEDDDEGGRKWWMIALAILLAGLVIGGAIALAGGGGDDDKEATDDSTTTSSSTTTSTSTTSTTLAPTTTTTQAPNPSDDPQINSFTASPGTTTCAMQTDSKSVMLAWSAANTSQVVLSVDGPGAYGTYAGGNGSQNLGIGCPAPGTSEQHTYTITAKGPNGPDDQRTITYSINTVP